MEADLGDDVYARRSDTVQEVGKVRCCAALEGIACVIEVHGFEIDQATGGDESMCGGATCAFFFFYSQPRSKASPASGGCPFEQQASCSANLDQLFAFQGMFVDEKTDLGGKLEEGEGARGSRSSTGPLTG